MILTGLKVLSALGSIFGYASRERQNREIRDNALLETQFGYEKQRTEQEEQALKTRRDTRRHWERRGRGQSISNNALITMMQNDGRTRQQKKQAHYKLLFNQDSIKNRYEAYKRRNQLTLFRSLLKTGTSMAKSYGYGLPKGKK